ncbi:hypothetical protein RGC55_06615 [Helicobacter pylori]|nr:hypothetical protein [Helicobacter pylori]
MGYQYIAPVKIKKMGFGVRGGFQYSYKAGNYMEKINTNNTYLE